MKKSVFIDGQYGTTGLKIHSRLNKRDDIKIVDIPEHLKKDLKQKEKILNNVDIVFLCLPDDAAKASVSLIKNDKVIVLDPSTAHRTSVDWVYGIPELNKNQRNKISKSKRISVPGCYATGFNICMHPLVTNGIVPSDYPVSCYSITGYSGGGKQMIHDYENKKNNIQEISCRPKNLNLAHKHLPEMKMYGLLDKTPIFTPIVGNFYQGILVFIPLHKSLLLKNFNQINLINFYKNYYKGEQFIKIFDKDKIKNIDDGFISPTDCNNSNNLDILIFENSESILIVTRFDNLGKGASGAAVQNMNIIIGVPENKGL